MTKSPVLIVKTNFDLVERLIRLPEEELRRELLRDDLNPNNGSHQLLDVLGYNFDDPVYGYWKQLEKEVQNYRKGSIFPCLELRRSHAIFHPSYVGSISLVMKNPPTDDIESLLRFQVPADPAFKSRFPLDFIFDLVFDFVSNNGIYDKALAKLKCSFDAKYVEIKRVHDKAN